MDIFTLAIGFSIGWVACFYFYEGIVIPARNKLKKEKQKTIWDEKS